MDIKVCSSLDKPEGNERDFSELNSFPRQSYGVLFVVEVSANKSTFLVEVFMSAIVG